MRMIVLLFVLSTTIACAQQVADTLFHYDIRQPKYPQGKGPLILLDEAHHNFHTTTGRFRPFVDFLRRDGYEVKGNPNPFLPEVLKKVRVLVIANALNAINEEQWSLPTPSAFTDDEIKHLVTWVQEGGSLFLIADHMPFPGAAEKLASAFGFTFLNGFAMRMNTTDPSVANALSVPDIFTPGHGLQESIITRGTRSEEVVTSVRTFTGQAFRIPDQATPIVVLDDRYQVLLPSVAWEFDKDTSTIPAAGLAQGASLQFGKGRLVVFGEAAMFSAQIQNNSVRMGMNAPDAKQNPQLLLNIIHWLDNAR